MALSTLRLISPVIGDHSHQPSEFPKREFCLQTKVKRSSQGSWLKPAMELAETGSETTSEELKIQNCSRGAYPKTPQVSACFARTLYTFIFQDVANGLSTFTCFLRACIIIVTVSKQWGSTLLIYSGLLIKSTLYICRQSTTA